MRFKITTSYGGGPDETIVQCDDYQMTRSIAARLSADYGARYVVRPGPDYKGAALFAEAFHAGTSEG